MSMIVKAVLLIISAIVVFGIVGPTLVSAKDSFMVSLGFGAMIAYGLAACWYILRQVKRIQRAIERNRLEEEIFGKGIK